MEWNNNIFTDTFNFITASIDKCCKDFNIEEAKIKDFEIDGKKWGSMEICLYNNDKWTSEEYYDWLNRKKK